MADAPLLALLEHIEAFSSRDNARYARALAIPFVHLWADGAILRYDTAADVDLAAHLATAGLDRRSFERAQLEQTDLVLDWPELKAFRVIFTRRRPGGEPSGRWEALWVTLRADGEWKLKLRIGARRLSD